VLSCQVEKVLEERDKLLVNKINLERELFDCKKELKFIKHTKTECESHLKILRIKMQEQTERRSSRSPRKVQSGAAGDSNHVVDDKTTSQSTEAATDPDHNSNNDSLMDDIENNLSAGEQSKKSEEIAECKQQ